MQHPEPQILHLLQKLSHTTYTPWVLQDATDMPKIRAVFFFFLFIFIAILVKLFFIQVAPSSNVSQSYLKYKQIYPDRGTILDRNQQPLALNRKTYLVFAEPKIIKDISTVTEKVAKELSADQASIAARLDPSLSWVKLAEGVSQKTKKTIEALKLRGVGFEEQSQRYYPEASLSAHLLGFVGKGKAGEPIGYFGVEGFYEQDLAGLLGFVKSERDLIGRPILIGDQEKIDSENGRDLILTVDKTVQNIAKAKLKSGLESYQAKEGCVIVANPYTLEMLALTCLPDYDPNLYYDSNDQTFNNQSISSLYEPGSTFKPLITAAGIEEKAIKSDSKFDEKGPVTIGEYTIRTWNNKYEGKISMTRILEKSSNVGMVYIGSKLGKNNVKKYVEEYGFGQKTGIDLQGESAGYIRDYWADIDYATVTFGQGIVVTPIQMVRAFSAVINGGNLMRPYIVKAMKTGLTTQEVKPKLDKKILSQKTSDIVKKMLVSTVEHGEYKWAIPEGYHIGGKTGTAQIAIGGKYDASKTIASFIGFAPADKPKFIALVVLKEPKSSIYGSETAAPIFFEIAKELLYYYNIPPSN